MSQNTLEKTEQKSVLAKIWPELSLYKKKLFFALSIGALVSLSKGVVPELFKNLEQAWEMGNKQMAWQIPFIISGAWIFSGITKYFHLFWMAHIADLVEFKLRCQLMDKYLVLNVGYAQKLKQGSSSLISRMISDIQLIKRGTLSLAEIIREPIMIVLMMGYLIYIDWKITFFVAVLAPLAGFVLRKFANSLKKHVHRGQESVTDLIKTLKEALDGDRIVQSFLLETNIKEKFRSQAYQFLQHRKKIISRSEAASPISESITSLGLSLLLIYIGQQIFSKKLDMGDLISFLIALAFLSDSFKKVQRGYMKMQESSVAMDRINNFIQKKDMIKTSPSPKKFPTHWKHISFKNVSFSYTSHRVLKNVTFSVKKGNTVAIVGSSGSGKSSLMNLLERFYDPDEGGIFIGDASIKDINVVELRKNIALVTQNIFLFNESIEYNIHTGDLSKTKEQIIEAARKTNAHSFITQCAQGYQTRVGDYGDSLSGGEKQRISIARAILKDAPILILDEATSALDTVSEQEVQKGLQVLMQGRTTFVVAHRLSTISKAHHILVLKEGCLVEQGSLQELLAQKGEFFKLYQQV